MSGAVRLSEESDQDVRVIVDDRESRSGVLEQLRAIKGIDTSIERLATGDYLVAGRVVVERKTLRDFAISIIDGRLFTQATRLASSGHRPLLILENDDLAPDQALPVKRDAIQGAMITLSLTFGIPVLRSLDLPETARLLASVASQVERSAGSVCRPGYRPRGKRRRQLFILQGLPCIGPHRAEKLLERFGTLRRIFAANIDNVVQVEGVGRNTAEKIMEILD
ncbi:MAG: nuclease [Verrucomicrobia bacterium]|nr:nuclease [Verrucomicrobiota bacterium]